jgi:hypothetical protein
MLRIVILASGLAFAASALAAPAADSPAAPAAGSAKKAPARRSPKAAAPARAAAKAAARKAEQAARGKAAKKQAAAAPAPKLPAMTAEQVVKRNAAARGGLEAWRAVTTLSMSGKMDAGGKPNVELPFAMKMKRGHKSRLELAFRDQTAVQVYDGAQGWKVRPFLNRNEVEPYSPAEAKAAAGFEDLDGPLIDHARKGTKVALAGTDRVEGKSAYKLKLTSKDGTQRTIWIDGRSFLELKLEGEPKKIDGRMRTASVYFRDYRTEKGLTTPRVLETVYEGTKVSRKMKIARVIANEPMPDALFQKPQVAMAGAPAAR